MSTQAPLLRSALTQPSEPGWTLITFCSGSTSRTCIAGHKARCSTEDIEYAHQVQHLGSQRGCFFSWLSQVGAPRQMQAMRIARKL